MHPAIGKVILIRESFKWAQMKISKAHLSSISREPQAAGAVDTILPTPKGEAMQVLVAPTEGNLDRVVEIGEGVVAKQEQSTPDHRTDLAQPDTELIDLTVRGAFLNLLHPVALPVLPESRTSALCHRRHWQASAVPLAQ